MKASFSVAYGVFSGFWLELAGVPPFLSFLSPLPPLAGEFFCEPGVFLGPPEAFAFAFPLALGFFLAEGSRLPFPLAFAGFVAATNNLCLWGATGHCFPITLCVTAAGIAVTPLTVRLKGS